MKYIAGALLLTLNLLSSASSAESQSRPNIILAMADDQGYGDMAYYGHPVLKTPTFDEMARTAWRFDHFYAGAPVCSPTRASVMTGRTPNRMGCFQWGHMLRPQERTIAELLKNAGYATGHFGKWHIGSVRPDCPVCPGNKGFERWFSSPNFFDLDPWMCDNGKAIHTKGEGSEVIVDAAIDFIKQSKQQNKPFLAVVWFGSPHDPHQGIPADLALYKDQPKPLANFYAEITAMDRAMGKLRHALRDMQIADNTFLWYCSDNGAIKQGSTRGLRGMKDKVYEGGLRVPALMEWPTHLKSPRILTLPCGTLDIFPTVLDVANIPIPTDRPLDGISLAPILEDHMTQRDKPMGFWHYAIGGHGVNSTKLLKDLADEQAAGTVRPWTQVQPMPPEQLRTDYPLDHFPGHSAWLSGDWKLHRIEPKGAETVKWELYNLAMDRVEAENLVEKEAARAEKLKKEMEEWLRSVVRSLNGKDY